MASQAEKNQKILDAEKAKPYPDPEIVYALESSRYLWNTFDTEKARSGWNKISNLTKQ